jgi:glycerol-3-phosphate acyltransferase PlsX
LKIALDAVGGDHGLTPNIDGAVQAANAFGVELVLVGPADKIRAELSSRGIGAGDPRFEVVDAPEPAATDEDHGPAGQARPRASVLACAALVADGRAAGLVSAGPLLPSIGQWRLKRLPGVLRAAVAVPIPTPKGVTVLLDAGANLDCKPWHLVQFAAMGAAFARLLHGAPAPTVGLLNVDEEAGKGNELTKEAFVQLKASGLAFKGCLDGGDVAAGTADVVVCDGFAGNVLVKTMEGAAAAVVGLLKAELTSKWKYTVPALALRGPLGRVRKRMSYDEYGGASLLGVDGVVVICHASSNARAVAHAVRAAARNAESGLIEALKAAAAKDPAAGQSALIASTPTRRTT